MRIKVVHIISSLGRGGRERQLSIICSHARSVDNWVICFNRREAEYLDEYEFGDKFKFISSRGFCQRLRDTRRLMQQLEPDLLISWGTMESLLAMLLSALEGVRFINFSIRHGIRRARWSHFSRMLVLHLSRFVVANSIAGLRANRLRRGMVLYNGVEKLPLEASEAEKRAQRKKLLGDVAEPLIVSVANFVPYKDYPTVLKTLNRIKNNGWEFHYIMIGEGPRRKELEGLINQLDLKDKVSLTGSVKNVDDYLSVCDFMVHSSLGEGCSNAILEGMKHGLPIVATRVGGTPEIITEENCLLFDYGDEDTLEQHVTSLLDDPVKRAAMGKRSRDIVLERFSVDKMIARYELIVNAVARQDKEVLSNIQVRVRE